MNVKYTVYFTGRIMKTVAFLFVFPAIIAVVFGEYGNLAVFLPLGAGIFVIGSLCSIKEPKNKRLTATEGFIIVALSWILISVTVAVAYYITGEIGSFINCLFESVSGFTTTGASVVEDVEIISKSVNALRLFTHWVGGMGILVLVLAIIPKNLDATTMNIFKAEVPGHQVEKFTDRLTMTAKILYLIYSAMTVILAISFMIAKMPVYDSIVHAMSIAGTGGFSVRNGSLGAYGSLPIEIIATVFMFLFGINMNVFYLILIGKFTSAIRSEELRTYFIIYVVAILSMAAGLTLSGTYDDFGTSLRYTAFQTASFMSTTGLYVVDFSVWTGLCQAILLVLMFIGACSGSTAGGMKISRIIIAGKYARIQYYKAARPNRVKTIRLEGERMEGTTVAATMSFLGLYMVLVFCSFVGVSLFEDVFSSGGAFGVLEKFTAVVSCVSNVGPGFGSLTTGTYDGFSTVSKLILCFDMLAGRLEILPMLFLFNPLSWIRKN